MPPNCKSVFCFGLHPTCHQTQLVTHSNSPLCHPGPHSPAFTSLCDHPFSASLASSFFTCPLNGQWSPISPLLSLFYSSHHMIIFSCIIPAVADILMISKSKFPTRSSSTLDLPFQLKISGISSWVPFKDPTPANKNGTHCCPKSTQVN